MTEEKSHADKIKETLMYDLPYEFWQGMHDAYVEQMTAWNDSTVVISLEAGSAGVYANVFVDKEMKSTILKKEIIPYDDVFYFWLEEFDNNQPDEEDREELRNTIRALEGLLHKLKGVETRMDENGEVV